MKSLLVARVDPNLERVWVLYQFQRDVTLEARSHVIELRGSEAAWHPERPYDSRFLGREIGWVTVFFADQLQELELMTMLEMLSTVEAVLRLDFKRRVDHRIHSLEIGGSPGQGPVSRRFYGTHALRGRSVRIDEDILEAWKSEASVKVSDLRGAWKLRDWLAHGRHWHPNLGRAYHPALVYEIAEKLLDSISNAPEGSD